ncbi:MAG: hypothetical protein A3J38_09800 [Gammaproteobacteria bacterium RIFCSPHIGHO2_12_FULL_45_9]|nr:MAG: hypothetical protein A3J38_09800 [Gammaproteobacteria bacterium RIFCSPHIGHO2_12_FULL_45_9]
MPTLNRPTPGIIAFIIGVALILLLMALWQIFFPLAGLTFVMTAALWFWLSLTLSCITLAILLLFLVTGLGVLFVGAGVLGWGLLSLFLFPMLIPFILPGLIILCFAATITRKKRRAGP